MNRYANEIHYPHRLEINVEDVEYSIKTAEKIKNFEPIKKINKIVNETNVE